MSVGTSSLPKRRKARSAGEPDIDSKIDSFYEAQRLCRAQFTDTKMLLLKEIGDGGSENLKMSLLDNAERFNLRPKDLTRRICSLLDTDDARIECLSACRITMILH